MSRYLVRRGGSADRWMVWDRRKATTRRSQWQGFNPSDRGASRGGLLRSDGSTAQGQEAIGNPIRVIAFNTAERWSQDVSEDVAREIRRRCDLQAADVPSAIQDFVERHEGHTRQLSLRLV